MFYSHIRILPMFVWILGVATGNVSAKPATVSDREEFTRQVEVPGNSKILEFHHQNGNVTVIGWDKPFILLEGTKQLSAESIEQLRTELRSLQIIAYERAPNRLVLECEKPSTSLLKSAGKSIVDYTAHVPRSLALDLDTRQGSTTVNGIQSSVLIDHRIGDVKVESIGGKIQIRNQQGNVMVRSVAKNLKLDTRDGNLDAADVGGEAAVRHQNGEVQIKNVSGSLILNCQTAQIRISEIAGRVEIDNRRGDVVCTSFHDAIRAYLYRGILKLEPDIPIPQNYYCDVDGGDIIFRVPPESSMFLEALAESGRIHSDFPLPIWAEGNVSYVRGPVNDSRFNVRLQVRNGSVAIYKTNFPQPNK